MSDAHDRSACPTPLPPFDLEKFAKLCCSYPLVRRGSMRVQVQVRVADDEAPESGIYPTRLVVLGAVTGAAMNEELTHRERFVLLYVDGASSIADILGTLEAVGYAREEVATILRALVERGLVVVRRAQALVREIA